MSISSVFVAVQQDPAGLYAMSAGRIGSLVAGVIGLVGAVVGGRGLVRAIRRTDTGTGTGTGSERRAAVVALVAGLAGMAIGALVVATSDAGIGTGNGRGGAYVALVVSLIAAALGGLTLARSRSLTDPPQSPADRSTPAQ